MINHDLGNNGHYRIWRERGPGFFSILSGILGHLRIAESLKLQPVIDMQHHPGTYSENVPIFGTRNMWEYYFDPIGNPDIELHSTDINVVDCGGQFPFKVLQFPFSEIPWIHEIFGRYVHPREESRAAFLQARSLIEPNSRTLAVHFRGKEMRRALHHPMPPTEKQIFRRIESIFDNYDFDRIFLVTEGADYVELFKSRYGRLVSYLDVARSGSRNTYSEYPRANHKYLLGLEILTEATLMSECGGLVCGFSNVSQMTEVMANGNFLVLERVWNGKLRGGKILGRYLWDYRRLAPQTLGGFKP